MLISILANTAEPPAARSKCSLTTIVGSYKSAVSRQWRIIRGISELEAVWQVSFHEHVVRDEESSYRIREYILNNPLQWELDKENPARTGENEFYRWMESRNSQRRP
jgi:hypothetical protein